MQIKECKDLNVPATLMMSTKELKPFKNGFVKSYLPAYPPFVDEWNHGMVIECSETKDWDPTGT